MSFSLVVSVFCIEVDEARMVRCLTIVFFWYFFSNFFEGGRCSSSNQAQSTGNSILDDFRPSAEKIEKISKNDENKSFDFRDYTFCVL